MQQVELTSTLSMQASQGLYDCLFTRQNEKSSLTKLGPGCYKKYLSECRLMGHVLIKYARGTGTRKG